MLDTWFTGDEALVLLLDELPPQADKKNTKHDKLLNIRIFLTVNIFLASSNECAKDCRVKSAILSSQSFNQAAILN